MDHPGTGRWEVSCPACGEAVERHEAREYDKDGDAWERRGKRYEYLCPDCHDDLQAVDRAGLEELLVEINAGSCDRATFFRRYRQATQGRRGPTEEQ